MSGAEVSALIARLEAWSARQDDLHAVVLVGSQARSTQPADRWSDVDVVLVTDTPRRYLDDGGWASALGDVCLSYVEPTAVGGFEERRVLFEDGLECDVAVLPSAVQELSGAGLEPLLAVARRGMRVLLDRDGWAGRIAAAARESPPPSDEPPTAAAFAGLVADHLHHVLWAARKLARGERFVAFSTLDGLLAARYVQMAGWHARAVGGTRDTWHAGRLLESWADPVVVAELPRVTARCEDADLRRALVAALDAFGRLAAETGAALGHEYPHVAHARVAALTAAALRA